MKVSKNNLMTVTEEYDYILDQIHIFSDFFVWDVHPNKIKTSNITIQRLKKRLYTLLDSEEAKEYNLYYNGG